jgi:hypothetical protein
VSPPHDNHPSRTGGPLGVGVGGAVGHHETDLPGRGLAGGLHRGDRDAGSIGALTRSCPATMFLVGGQLATWGTTWSFDGCRSTASPGEPSGNRRLPAAGWVVTILPGGCAGGPATPEPVQVKPPGTRGPPANGAFSWRQGHLSRAARKPARVPCPAAPR